MVKTKQGKQRTFSHLLPCNYGDLLHDMSSKVLRYQWVPLPMHILVMGRDWIIEMVIFGADWVIVWQPHRWGFKCHFWDLYTCVPIVSHLHKNQGWILKAQGARDLSNQGTFQASSCQFFGTPIASPLVQLPVPLHHPKWIQCVSVCNMDGALWVEWD